MVDPVKVYFNEIYDALFYKVTNFIVSKCSDLGEVEDIVQEVFIEVYKLIEKRGVGYINNTEAMVMRVAKFKLYRHYNLLKTLKNRIAFFKKDEDGQEYETEELAEENVESKYINTQTLNEVFTFLKTKPENTKKIFTLYYYSDKTIKEIAEIMKTSESQVKHKLYRTLAEIRNIYKKEV